MRIYDNSATYVAPVSPRVKDDESACFYVPSPVDCFLSEALYSGSDEVPALHIGCDVSIILNQQRISKEIQPLVEEWFTAHKGDLSDKYSNLSDNDILSCIKSKYLQRPSELVDWSNYLMQSLDELQAQRLSEAQEKAEFTPPVTDGKTGNLTL
ncbi:internal scaffolding protein [Peromfec virus RodF7_5]|uniref:Internal scaffolding protein n=1 Tax=Peromfec virus RodF7_5 TaxID=2929354 RepID=A0A976R8C0_9VIRU|nr:internal scaffolding protein [Peromfec virus RodF7_5]